MDKPLISVVVPVYNVEEYLPKCLDSILAQDYDNVEIIVVDDGTPDNSGIIADEYAAKFSNIKVIHQKNTGLGGARNTGIDLANGEYIIFIDSDDYIESDMISTLFKTIYETKSEISVCRFNEILENGKILDVSGHNISSLNKPMKLDSSRELFDISPAAWNKLYKISLFKESNIRYPSRVWYEDIRTTFKLFAVADSISFTDKPLYNYLLREGSIMRNPNIERNREIIDAMEDLLSFFKSNDLYDKYFNELEFMTAQHVFWETSVRILQITGHHKLLNELRDYTFSNFPKALGNEKFKSFVREKGIKGRIIHFCLRFKLYRLLHWLLKTNKAV